MFKRNSFDFQRLAIPAAAAALAFSGSGRALDFEVGNTNVRLENLVSIGASMRMQKRDDALVIAEGTMTTVHVDKKPGEALKSAPIPQAIVAGLRSVSNP